MHELDGENEGSDVDGQQVIEVIGVVAVNWQWINRDKKSTTTFVHKEIIEREKNTFSTWNAGQTMKCNEILITNIIESEWEK